MMGRSHALSGWVAGLAVAPLAGLSSVAEVVPFAAVTAGYALLPDLDHPSASASRLLGPVTGLLSKLVRGFSSVLYKLTKGPRDERGSGRHRHATHTLAAAVGLGELAASAATHGGRWAVLGVALFGLVMAVDSLGDRLLAVLAAAAAALAVDSWLPGTSAASAIEAGLAEIGSWVGVAVGVGMFVHCLGDTLTRSGCPWLWPLPIRGETWYELRPPKALRFRTGGPVELWLVVPALLVGAVLLLPGALPVAESVVSAVVSSTKEQATP